MFPSGVILLVLQSPVVSFNQKLSLGQESTAHYGQGPGLVPDLFLWIKFYWNTIIPVASTLSRLLLCWQNCVVVRESTWPTGISLLPFSQGKFANPSPEVRELQVKHAGQTSLQARWHLCSRPGRARRDVWQTASSQPATLPLTAISPREDCTWVWLWLWLWLWLVSKEFVRKCFDTESSFPQILQTFSLMIFAWINCFPSIRTSAFF